jgi:hypothetical protein
MGRADFSVVMARLILTNPLTINPGGVNGKDLPELLFDPVVCYR